MRTMYKKTFIVAAFIGIAAAAVIGVSHARAARQDAQDTALYETLSLFSEGLTIIKHNYVEAFEVKKVIYGALKGMLESLDEFSQFLTPAEYEDLNIETEGTFGGVGIVITLRDGVLTVISPLEGTPAFEAGLKPMDRIVSIDGESTRDISLSKVTDHLRGKPGTKVTLKIFREEKDLLFDVTLTRRVIHVKSVKDVSVLEGEVGYVKIVEFQESTPQELEKALEDLKRKNIKALVLDLRNNPGGILESAVYVASYFLPKDKIIVSTRGRAPEDTSELRALGRTIFPDEPLAVLVNGGSASASEIVAAALKDYKRAVIIGTRTFGKGSIQTVFPLEDGSALKLTTALYYSPLGKVIQKEGVAPDVLVESAEDMLDNEAHNAIDRTFATIELPENTRAKTPLPTREQLEKMASNKIDLQREKALEVLKALTRGGTTK